MSQNYFMGNPFGLARGISESSNFSLSSVGYPLQPSTMVLNACMSTPRVLYQSPLAFCTNLESYNSFSSPSKVANSSQKENVPVTSETGVKKPENVCIEN